VFLKADVELGGTDQLFNLNVGRDIMPSYGLEPQVVMTTPLLEGLDGVEKMSKSLGNYVGVTDSPSEMFGKLMSVSDELMWRYYLLLTDLSARDIDDLARTRKHAAQVHPKHAKVDLARRIVSDFHSAADADQAAPPSTRSFHRVNWPATCRRLRSNGRNPRSGCRKCLSRRDLRRRRATRRGKCSKAPSKSTVKK
jgi:tyrosyl-tRNA synthetase